MSNKKLEAIRRRLEHIPPRGRAALAVLTAVAVFPPLAASDLLLRGLRVLVSEQDVWRDDWARTGDHVVDVVGGLWTGRYS